MTTSVADQVAHLVGHPRSRPQLIERFAKSRGDQARTSEAADLLDQLALAGRTSDVCLEALLELLYEHGLARSAIRRLLVNEADVAEAEQRSLAAVALKLDSFEGRSRFTTWLHTIATNEARMMIRSRSRRNESFASIGDVPEVAFFARLSTLLGNRDLVEQAMAALGPAQREVLMLREVEGLEYEAISDQLGVPIGTVRSRLSRAREALASSVRLAMR